MSGFRGSFWGTAKKPAPEPAPVVKGGNDLVRFKPKALSAEQLRSQSLATQMARALRDELTERKMTVSAFADIMSQRWENIQRVLEGRPCRFATLEKFCFKLGWQVRIHDRMGRVIVDYPPSEDSTAGSPATAPE